MKHVSFLDLAKQRYSSRSFKNYKVEDEKILKILEAGRIAPSAANFQPWIFYVIRGEEVKNQVSSSYKRDWVKQAPVLIVVCGDHKASWKREDSKDFCDVDIAIAADHMTLQATELDLATCWVCNFDVKKVKEVLALEEHIEPLVILPVGYPADNVNATRHSHQRKQVGEIVKWI